MFVVVCCWHVFARLSTSCLCVVVCGAVCCLLFGVCRVANRVRCFGGCHLMLCVLRYVVDCIVCCWLLAIVCGSCWLLLLFVVCLLVVDCLVVFVGCCTLFVGYRLLAVACVLFVLFVVCWSLFVGVVLVWC